MKLIKTTAILLSMLSACTVMAATKKTNEPEISEITYVKYHAPQTKAASTKKPVASKKDLPATEDPKLNTSCEIKYIAFEDIRANKATVGTNFMKSLSPQGISVWLQDAEVDLWEKRIKNSGGSKTLTLQPKLTKLYSYPQGMNIYGVMGVTVDYLVDGKVIESRKYRGSGATTNAWNAEHEYYDALSDAAHDVMPKILQDVSGICKKLNPGN